MFHFQYLNSNALPTRTPVRVYSNSKMSNNPAPLAQSSTTASRTRRAAQWAFKALVSYFALGDPNFQKKALHLLAGDSPGYLMNST